MTSVRPTASRLYEILCPDRRLSGGQITLFELGQRDLCISRRVDRLQRCGDRFAVLVAGKAHGMAQEMDDTGLDLGLGKGRFDGLRKALEAVYDGNEDVLDTPM